MSGNALAQTRVLPDDEHNRELVQQVHPEDWTNPVPDGPYNLVVIGGGTAGLVAAVGSAGIGAKVALIERDLLGGDCLNHGCVPSKALLRAGHAAHDVRTSSNYGVRLNGGFDVDFSAAMERMRRLRAHISHHDSAARFRDLGVDVFLGEAKFTGPETIHVDGSDLSFSRAVIATGGKAILLPIPGLEEAEPLTNETLFSLTEQPEHLIVIGAGPIGCEMAQAFRRLGSEVTMFEVADRIMPREDSDAVAIVQQRFDEEGITVHTNTGADRVERDGDTRTVVFERDGQEHRVSGDALLVAVGRAPNTDGLQLDKAGVEYDKQGVKVNERLQTTNPIVFAAGDICSKYKFTHAADAMARIVIENALFFRRKKVSDLVIPWCTYTDPEVAHVGMYEEEAREAGYDVQTLTISLDDLDRAILDGETEGFARAHVTSKGRVLGATIVARHAGEMIGEMALAVTKKLSIADIAATIHPYPTQAEVLKKLGDEFRKQSLTPTVKGLFERYFKFRQWTAKLGGSNESS